MGTYDCSFQFDNEEVAKKYKYLIVIEGDLDINNTMLLRTKKDLNNYLKEHKEFSSRKILCILKVRKVMYNGRANY